MTAPIFGQKPPRVSSGKQRTQEAAAAIEAGFHPLGNALARNGKSCGNCIHAFAQRSAHTYWKCDLRKVTSGAGTDIRLAWPACVDFEAQP